MACSSALRCIVSWAYSHLALKGPRKHETRHITTETGIQTYYLYRRRRRRRRKCHIQHLMIPATISKYYPYLPHQSAAVMGTGVHGPRRIIGGILTIGFIVINWPWCGWREIIRRLKVWFLPRFLLLHTLTNLNRKAVYSQTTSCSIFPYGQTTIQW